MKWIRMILVNDKFKCEQVTIKPSQIRTKEDIFQRLNQTKKQN